MGEVINRALRSLTVLAIIGAVAGFALVALPNGANPAVAAALYPAYSVEVDNVGATTLALSHSEVRPNESVTVWGRGFGTTPGNALSSAQIGGVDLMVSSHGGNLADVEVSPSGQFNATFAIWPANPSDANPTLRGGMLEIAITDAAGLVGTADIAILPPTLTLTPGEVGPRDYVVISGANWPVGNSYGGAVSKVKLEITGDGFEADAEEEWADDDGNWSVRYRVPGNVGIPSAISVQASYGASNDILVIAKIQVAPATMSVAPNRVVPCGRLTLNGSGFTLYESDIAVKIGNKDVAIPTGASTDREGEIKDLTVIVPGLDAGTYTVHLQVGEAVASSAVTVLDGITHDYDALSPSLSVVPDQVVPSGDLTLNAAGFPRCESWIITVKIGQTEVTVPTGTHFDRAGKVKDLTVKVPSLDAGTYIVQLQVGRYGVPVAFSEVTILDYDARRAAELPGALAPLGNNLVRVFHFNNATKTWTFYDPRPEFAELNTLSAFAAGEPYWVLVGSDQSVTLNGRAHTFICQRGDCWNILVW